MPQLFFLGIIGAYIYFNETLTHIIFS